MNYKSWGQGRDTNTQSISFLFSNQIHINFYLPTQSFKDRLRKESNYPVKTETTIMHHNSTFDNNDGGGDNKKVMIKTKWFSVCF